MKSTPRKPTSESNIRKPVEPKNEEIDPGRFPLDFGLVEEKRTVRVDNRDHHAHSVRKDKN